MTELKGKLRQQVLQYNALVEENGIDVELACSLTDGYILPWEGQDEGMMISTSHALILLCIALTKGQLFFFCWILKISSVGIPDFTDPTFQNNRQ